MDKTFKGTYVSIYMRIAKKMAPVFMLVLFVLFKLYYGRSGERIAEYRNYFLILMAICLLIGIYFHVNKARTVISEVRISDDKFKVIGQDFTSKYEDSLDINNTMLELQLEESGSNKNRYCLEIYSEDKYYYINKFNDWDYSTIAQIIDEYQLKTGRSVAGMELYPKLVQSS